MESTKPHRRIQFGLSFLLCATLVAAALTYFWQKSQARLLTFLWQKSHARLPNGDTDIRIISIDNVQISADWGQLAISAALLLAALFVTGYYLRYRHRPS